MRASFFTVFRHACWVLVFSAALGLGLAACTGGPQPQPPATANQDSGMPDESDQDGGDDVAQDEEDQEVP